MNMIRKDVCNGITIAIDLLNKEEAAKLAKKLKNMWIS